MMGLGWQILEMVSLSLTFLVELNSAHLVYLMTYRHSVCYSEMPFVQRSRLLKTVPDSAVCFAPSASRYLFKLSTSL